MRHEVDTPYGKHFIEVRFVIKHPDGSYFTEMKETGKRVVMMNGSAAGDEFLYTPQFEAQRPRFASQFDTERDAASVMQDSRFGGPDVHFKGCVVVPSTSE